MATPDIAAAAAIYQRYAPLSRTEVVDAAIAAGIANAAALSKEDAIKALGGRPA